MFVVYWNRTLNYAPIISGVARYQFFGGGGAGNLFGRNFRGKFGSKKNSGCEILGEKIPEPNFVLKILEPNYVSKIQ